MVHAGSYQKGAARNRKICEIACIGIEARRCASAGWIIRFRTGSETTLRANGRSLLSAAQPQPNDRGEINAFVPDLALHCAALKGATSSPTGGRESSGLSGRTVRSQKSRTSR